MSPETANAIFEKRFSQGTTPRSAPYKIGFRHALTKTPDRDICKPGTAEFDAYWAGYDDGRNSAQQYLDLVTREMERRQYSQ